MRAMAIFGIIAAVSMVAADAPKELQGTWTVTKMERGGKVDEKAVGGTFTVDGDKFTSKTKNEPMKGTLKVDAGKKPATIDLVMKDPNGQEFTMSGVYQIDGDTLKCCFPLEPGKDRPKEISAKEDTMMVTLKKEKK